MNINKTKKKTISEYGGIIEISYQKKIGTKRRVSNALKPILNTFQLC